MPDPGPFIADRPAPERKPPPWWAVAVGIVISPIVWMSASILWLIFVLVWWVFLRLTWDYLLKNSYSIPRWMKWWRRCTFGDT